MVLRPESRVMLNPGDGNIRAVHQITSFTIISNEFGVCVVGNADFLAASGSPGAVVRLTTRSSQ